MENGDGAVVITYNGEIYNFTRAARRARAQRPPFRTRSDTEVIIHHFEQYGARGIAALDGMFAFAIWDGARAPADAGARPRSASSRCTTPSSPTAASCSRPSCTRCWRTAASPASVDRRASRRISAPTTCTRPHTIVRGIRKLPPGHALVWQDGSSACAARLLAMPAPAPTPISPTASWRRSCGRALDRAVASQLVADVPVGILLSGGIDSSCVATAGRGARAGA